MAYTINLTDGSVFATIADGTINTSSSMTLIGKNYAGYGQFLDDNFIHLLENSSNTTAPTAPLTGQLWWDKTNSLLKVYNGTTFKTISAATASSTQPTSNVTGDLWFDTVNQQLKVYTGSTWLLIGPQYTAGQGTSGAIVATVVDNVATSHTVIQLWTNDSIVGMISKDAAFTPGSSISGGWGIQQVKPGITLNSLIGSQVPLFQGTATDAQTLDSLDSTQFMRSDANTSTTGTLAVLNNTGLSVGSNQDFKATVSGTAVTVSNQTTNGNLNISVNVGGSPTNVIAINGTTGVVSIPSLSANLTGNVGSITSSGNITANYFIGNGSLLTGVVATTVGTLSSLSVTGNVTAGGLVGTVYTNSIVNTGANATGNIGSSSTYFNTVFARATSAAYADVAERFEADTFYDAGTVVELGGDKEITKVTSELSDSVFGVISTRAAYLMNSAAGTDETHPPVAMTGRVPVKIVGQVRKGDRLVSAGNGYARAAKAGEATAFNVIGRALTHKLDDSIGTVEAIVTIK